MLELEFLEVSMTLHMQFLKILIKKKNLSYINTPYKIRDQYQYFTKANIKKLREVGFKDSFFSLEDGIEYQLIQSLRLL